MGVKNIIPELAKIPAVTVKEKIINIFEREDFLQNVGPGASSKSKMLARIKAVNNGLAELISE